MLRITEQAGTTVMENTIYVNKGDIYSMDLSDLKSGLYILEVSSKDGKTVKKIIKE